MSKIFNLDEMLELVAEIEGGFDTGFENGGGEKFQNFRQKLEEIGNEMGEVIATHFGVTMSSCDAQGTAFGGTCGSFSPAFEGQKMPEAFLQFDQGGEWE